MGTPIPESGVAPGRGDGAPPCRLDAYLARSQRPLDLLSLVTLWLVIVPPWAIKIPGVPFGVVLALRLSLSLVYAIDMAIRSVLARRHLHYLVTHPLGCLVVIFPAIRVLFSLRLLRSIFERGELFRFLLAAALLLLNAVVIVYFLEHTAPGANITTIGEALWWGIVTVTTVGYGDNYPVTAAGRVVASFVMAIGIVVLAVVTAHISSMFVEQSARRRDAAQAEAGPTPDELRHREIADRLDHIESLLNPQQGSV